MADMATIIALIKALGGGGGGGGGVNDVKVDGQSVVTDGVANVPIASNSTPGVVKVETYGISLNSNDVLRTLAASDNTIKAGTDNFNPVVPKTQHSAAFYGLAKAAGDSTQSASSNAVGTYTETAKSAISQMLNAPETVSGSTPTIAAKAGVCYECGECSTLDITTPTTGVVDFVFESGSTPTVLTVAPTGGQASDMEWPDWFDPTSLEANATYEISVRNGTLGTVMVWA